VVSSGTLQDFSHAVELKKILFTPKLSVELTFLGNKYEKSEKTSSKPMIQLKYMGKTYRSEPNKAVRNSVVLTYRGVSYSRA
jgi:hypothetical protein